MLMLLLRQKKSLTIKADKRKAAQLAENERRFDWLVNVSMNSEGFICVREKEREARERMHVGVVHVSVCGCGWCASEQLVYLFLSVRAPVYVF